MRRHIGIYLVALALLISPAAVRAAESVDSLCAATTGPGGARSTRASATTLDTAASVAETLFETAPDKAVAGDRAMTMLGGVANDAAPTDDAALARFCAAAGEAYRLGREGNPYQARALLTAAFRHAEAGRAPAAGALAAYRIGLLSQNTGMTGGRGLRRSLAASPDAGPAVAEGSCDALAAPESAQAREPRLAALGFGCAVERARAGGDDRLAAQAALSFARFWLAYARRTPAEAARARATARTIAIGALATAGRIDEAAPRALLLGRLADAALDAQAAGDPRLAAAVALMRQSDGGDPASRASADAVAGRLALAAADRPLAAALFRDAIFAESQAPLPLRLADLHLLLAEAEPAQRRVHVEDAFRALQAIRPSLPAFDRLTEESSFALYIRPVYEALIAARLDLADGADAQAIADVQQVAEGYRQAELQSLFGSGCIPARPPVTPAELAPGEILLYPILLPDRVELLYATGDGAGYRRLSPDRTAGRNAIVAAVGAMVDATSLGDDGWHAPARALYAALIAPIADKLSAGGTLVIVPDGVLSALPFAALIDEHGRFLIERSRIDVVPSLAYAQPGAAHGTAAPRVVAAALEKEQHFAFGTYDALTGTGTEARFAAGMDGDGESGGGRHGVLLENFRRADLARALAGGDVDVLHLATHANFNGRSDRSYIVADGELIPISDLRAMIERSRTRGAELDLIVLSACESAVGDDEASMGLAGAAVQAGARSAIASLWKVNDQGTAALMRNFYTRYRAGAGKAEALRGAQMEMIAKGGEFADPGIWAAFTLLGSWR